MRMKNHIQKIIFSFENIFNYSVLFRRITVHHSSGLQIWKIVAHILPTTYGCLCKTSGLAITGIKCTYFRLQLKINLDGWKLKLHLIKLDVVKKRGFFSSSEQDDVSEAKKQHFIKCFTTDKKRGK
jgi:hypothetical protein